MFLRNRDFPSLLVTMIFFLETSLFDLQCPMFLSRVNILIYDTAAKLGFTYGPVALFGD